MSEETVFEESSSEFKFENNIQKDHFHFLDALRDSGECNMYESPAWLREAFPLVKRVESFEIFKKWADSFSQRHPEGDK